MLNSNQKQQQMRATSNLLLGENEMKWNANYLLTQATTSVENMDKILTNLSDIVLREVEHAS